MIRFSEWFNDSLINSVTFFVPKWIIGLSESDEWMVQWLTHRVSCFFASDWMIVLNKLVQWMVQWLIHKVSHFFHFWTNNHFKWIGWFNDSLIKSFVATYWCNYVTCRKSHWKITSNGQTDGLCINEENQTNIVIQTVKFPVLNIHNHT